MCFYLSKLERLFIPAAKEVMFVHLPRAESDADSNEIIMGERTDVYILLVFQITVVGKCGEMSSCFFSALFVKERRRKGEGVKE